MAKKENQYMFNAPVKTVFDAAVAAINADKKAKLKSADEASGEIKAGIGVSMISWGEQISILVADAGGGQTSVSIRSASNYGLIDYGKNAANIDRLVKGIADNLPQG